MSDIIIGVIKLIYTKNTNSFMTWKMRICICVITVYTYSTAGYLDRDSSCTETKLGLVLIPGNAPSWKTLEYFSHSDCYKADVHQDLKATIFRVAITSCLFRSSYP